MKHSSRIIVGMGSLLLLLVFAAPAVGADKKGEAEVHYDQGKAYYKAGAFDLAIQEFLAGYKLDPRPGVLFNIARGYEELKDKPKAIEFYKKYVDLGAAAAAATEARARMVVLERQIKEDEEHRKAEEAERERERQAALNPPPAMPTPVETKGPGATTTAAATPGAPGTPSTGGGPEGAVTVTGAAEPGMSAETARTLKIAGIATAGAGVLLAGAGGFFAWRASSLKSDINGEYMMTNTWTDGLTTKDSDMKSAQTFALIGFIAGGAAVAGGAVLYYLGWSKTPGADTGGGAGTTALLSPTVGPDGSAALLLSGRF